MRAIFPMEPMWLSLRISYFHRYEFSFSCGMYCKEGGFVEGIVAIFSYNFHRTREAFEDANVILHTLSNYDALLEERLHLVI